MILKPFETAPLFKSRSVAKFFYSFGLFFILLYIRYIGSHCCLFTYTRIYCAVQYILLLLPCCCKRLYHPFWRWCCIMELLLRECLLFLVYNNPIVMCLQRDCVEKGESQMIVFILHIFFLFRRKWFSGLRVVPYRQIFSF